MVLLFGPEPVCYFVAAAGDIFYVRFFDISLYDCINFSEALFVAPITLTGLTALSVDTNTNLSTKYLSNHVNLLNDMTNCRNYYKLKLTSQ